MASTHSVIRWMVDRVQATVVAVRRIPLLRNENCLQYAVCLRAALDRVTAPMLVTDARSSVTYANPAAKEMCAAHRDSLRSVWPEFTGDDITGVCLDLPAEVTGTSLRAFTGDGGRQFRLQTTVIFDPGKNCIGNVLEWSVPAVTAEGGLEGENKLHDDAQLIRQSAKTISESSERLTGMSRQLLAHAEATAGEAEEIAAASDEVSGSVSIMEAGGTKMMTSIREIAESSVESARVAQSAVAMAEGASQTISKLSASSREIGKVVDVIASVGRQTNLLALNATIESAHAGKAGRGFAVVAKEVLQLSKETAGATSEVRDRIAAIQADSHGVVLAMGEIQAVVIQMSDLAKSIAARMEEQTATTNQMGRNVKGASRGAADIASHITSVAIAAQSTTEDANQTLQAALDLGNLASQIEALAARIVL